jgi:hypothetical protein
LQDTFQELKHALCKEGFLMDYEKIEEEMFEESYQEDLDEVYHVVDLDETFDEDEVLISALQLGEDIHASSLLHIKKRT